MQAGTVPYSPPEASDPLIHGRPDDGALTRQLLQPLFTTSPAWWVAVAVCGAGTLLFAALVVYTVSVGIGAWGNNIPVAWGVAIINFVWWGHAGALISAALLLMEQRWRVAVGRIAEVMALFSLLNAAIFPLLHLGRPWFFYWMFPYPNSLELWPQFLSSLTWDVAGLLAMLTVTGLFLYVGLLPDFAEVRDFARGRGRRLIYGVLALGWRGSGRQWFHYRLGTGLLAGLVIAMAVTMHSIASLDFATTLLPGWHMTTYPPGFLARGLHSGAGMLLLLVLLLRHVHALHNVLTRHHMNALALVLLATSWLVFYTVAVETFVAWYGGAEPERYLYLVARPAGPYSVMAWLAVLFVFLVPQLFWWPRMRRSVPALLTVSILVSVGMWLERFVVVTSSLNRGFLPSSWALYPSSWVEGGILLGSVSFFGLLFLLAVRIIPMVPVSEMKELRRGLHPEEA